MPPEINISVLENILRLELRSKDLTEVGEDFYKEVRKYISDLKDKMESETLKKNYRGISKISNELEKAEGDFRKIVEIRASKILKARAENFKASIEGKMTPEERIFYDAISQSFKEHMDSLITGNIIIQEVSQTQRNETIRSEKNLESGEPVENLRIVYVNKDTPTLVIEGRSVKLKKEDILTMPERYAKILEAQGLAKIIK